MRRRSLAAAVIVLLAACAKKDSGSSPSMSIYVSPGRVKADGTSAVTVTVAGASKAPITVTATRGTFASGSTIADVTGSVALTTCDARTSTSCAGTVQIVATDAANVTAVTSAQFYGFETVCNDGIDNNGDGKIDCADPDCDQKVCKTSSGTAGTCQGNVCVAPTCSGSVVETGALCSNGLDDDCNGQIDCQDSSCDGQPCKTGSPSFVCANKQCVDGTSGYGISIVPARTRMPADGASVAPVRISVTSGGTASAGAAVTVSTTAGTLSTTPAVGIATSVSATTDATGSAIVYFAAPALAATATITATLTATPSITQSATIVMPAVGQIALQSVQFPVMGARASGVNELNKLSVVVLDVDQKPYPDGLAVHFEHSMLGGSTISQPWGADTATCKGPTAVPPGNCLSYDTVTASAGAAPDSLGVASVNLYSGTIAGPVTVTATVTVGGTTLSYAIPPVVITGAKASGSAVSIDCSPKNIPALTDDDCRTTFYAGAGSTITCTGFFADRYGNVLGLSTPVQFRAENGATSPPSATIAYDPTKDGSTQRSLGTANGFLAVTGYDLPFDVAPIPGEYSYVSDLGCGLGPTTQNPRDGLVTIIVMTRGEEGFVDGSNGCPADGKFQPKGDPACAAGEDFIDLGEPFIDANDNSQWDPGEWYLDVNGNGKYDGPNGQWDSDTVVWAETRVVYTGFPTIGQDALARELYSRAFSGLISPPAPTSPIGTVTVISSGTTGGDATSKEVKLFFTDRNFNPPPAAMVTYGAKVLNGSDITFALTRQPAAVDHLPMGFTQVYCDQYPGMPSPPATPPVCANHCSANPCYVVTDLQGFEYGAWLTGLVTGGAKPATDVAQASATLEGVSTDVEFPVQAQ